MNIMLLGLIVKELIWSMCAKFASFKTVLGNCAQKSTQCIIIDRRPNGGQKTGKRKADWGSKNMPRKQPE